MVTLRFAILCSDETITIIIIKKCCFYREEKKYPITGIIQVYFQEVEKFNPNYLHLIEAVSEDDI